MPNCNTCEKNVCNLKRHYLSQSHIDMIDGVKKNYCVYCKYQARDSDKYKRHCKTKKHLKNEDIVISKIKKDKDKYTEEELEILEDEYLFGEDNSLKYHSKYMGIYDLYRKEVQKWKNMDKKLDKVQFCLDNFCEIIKQNNTELLYKNLYKEWELISNKLYAKKLIKFCMIKDDKDNQVEILYKIKNKLKV